MSTYPADPQATEGLRKCMYILERMHFIRPAAWRANQLLQGSRAVPHDFNTITLKAATPERHKRHAASMDDGMDGQDASLSPEVTAYRAPAGDFEEGAGGSGAGQGAAGFALPLELAGTDPQAFYPPYSRWGADGCLPPSLAGGLSTSVLPPRYSTGLVDERVQRSQDRPSRYPQYWSDYSAMGQMDATYGMPVMGDMVASQAAAQQPDPPMYVQDQYPLYSEYARLMLCIARTLPPFYR